MFKKGDKCNYIRVILKASAWKRVPLRLLRWGRRMPSTAQYDLVPNDEYDTRIPLHPDQAFTYGITFHAKYIGTMDVPRPTSRVEIVAAMRRVRYEFKTKRIKKRKVTVDISTEGVRITTRRSKVKSKAMRFFTRKSKSGNTECIEIMHHPIYRIFYVSHDSSDLKIFSYIARDGATNVFKCNVFKSKKKNQAMRIVRTVGQAFEVCHKMNITSPDHPAPSTSSAADEPVPSCSDAPTPKAPESDCGASESGGASSSKAPEKPEPARPQRPTHLDLLPPPPRKENSRRPQHSVLPTINLPGLPDLSADLPECVTKVELTVPENDPGTPLSSQHQVKLLREQLEQQAQQTRAAVAQILLLRNQLAAEQTARCEAQHQVRKLRKSLRELKLASGRLVKYVTEEGVPRGESQARTHQLLVHNKELLEHIAALISHLHDQETGSPQPISVQQLTMLPQLSSSAKIDRWFSLLQSPPALSRPESGFLSAVEDTDAATLAEAKNLLLQLGVKKKKRILPLRFKRRVLVNKHTML